MSERYTIHVCPVCRRQVEWDPDYGYACFHYREYIEPIELEVAPPRDLAAKLADPELVARLDAFKRKDECWTAQLDWFRSLPKYEQDRLEAERRSKLTPFARMLEDEMHALAKESLLLNRKPFWIAVEAGTAQPEREEK